MGSQAHMGSSERQAGLTIHVVKEKQNLHLEKKKDKKLRMSKWGHKTKQVGNHRPSLS